MSQIPEKCALKGNQHSVFPGLFLHRSRSPNMGITLLNSKCQLKNPPREGEGFNPSRYNLVTYFRINSCPFKIFKNEVQ